MLILTSINAIIDHEKVLSNMDQELSIQVIQVAVDGVLDKVSNKYIIGEIKLG